MTKEKNKMRRVISLHLRGIKVLNSVSPRIFPVLTMYCIVDAVAPYAAVFLSAQVLKELAGLRRADTLWKWVAAAVLCVGVLSALKAFLNRRYETLLNDLWGRKEIIFARKMFSLDYSELDRQENRDLRKQIQQNEQWSGYGIMKVPYVYSFFVTGVAGVLSGVALTARLFAARVPEEAGLLTVLNSPLFILLFGVILVGISTLAGRFNSASNKRYSRLAEVATFGNRFFGHFMFIGLEQERSVDIRMNNQDRLIDAYCGNEHSFSANGPFGKAARGMMGVYSGLGACVSAVVIGFVYVFTCLKAWGGAFDVGSITQYVGAATAMVSNIFTLTSLFGAMENNAVYIEKTFEFLDIPNLMYQGSLTTEKRSDRQFEVEFRNVSFKYPGSEMWALRNVSMRFKVGKRLAIVGENGSGKTTFIKLLCRLYDPQEGEILLNGIDIRKYRYDDYMNIFSVVFQDFQLICQPIGANVAGSIHYDRERVRKALIDAGFGDRLAKMKQGLDTMIYKELSDDGVEVSGGEAQKIAIARALYKDAPFIILDEPTAALDPIAEAEIYARFDEIAGDKTAIYISHRLSSCKFCDEIAVFQDGRVVQQGTHESLVADVGGKYHELWNAQAQYYNE